jgi:hypothetical protein
MTTDTTTLNAVEAAGEAVTCAEPIVEAEEITPTSNESKRKCEGQNMQPGEKPKASTIKSHKTSPTSSLKVLLPKSGIEIKTIEAKDQMERALRTRKSMTISEMKSSNGTRMLSSRRTMPPKTMAP